MIRIRSATNDDHEAVSRVASELNAMHARALPDRFQVADEPMPSAYFHSLLESDEATVLAAERAGDVVGYAILRIKDAPPIPVALPRRVALLNDLAVAEVEQGQGIGRRLVDAAVDWTRDHGASALELDVFEFNEPAIAFYEYLGFSTSKLTMALPVDKP